VTVTGPVDVLDPVAQLRSGCATLVTTKFPPGGRRRGPVPTVFSAVTVVLVTVAVGEPAGQPSDLTVEGVEAGQGSCVFGLGAADLGDHAGQLAELADELGVMGSFADVEFAKLLAAGGELVRQGDDRIRGRSHGQLHGKDEPS